MDTVWSPWWWRVVVGSLNHLTPKSYFWGTFSRTFPPDKLVPLVAGFLNHFTPKFRFASTFSRTFPSDKLVTHSKRKENHHLFCHPEQHKMSVVKKLLAWAAKWRKCSHSIWLSRSSSSWNKFYLDSQSGQLPIERNHFADRWCRWRPHVGPVAIRGGTFSKRLIRRTHGNFFHNY